MISYLIIILKRIFVLNHLIILFQLMVFYILWTEPITRNTMPISYSLGKVSEKIFKLWDFGQNILRHNCVLKIYFRPLYALISSIRLFKNCTKGLFYFEQFFPPTLNAIYLFRDLYRPICIAVGLLGLFHIFEL